MSKSLFSEQNLESLLISPLFNEELIFSLMTLQGNLKKVFELSGKNEDLMILDSAIYDVLEKFQVAQKNRDELYEPRIAKKTIFSQEKEGEIEKLMTTIAALKVFYFNDNINVNYVFFRRKSINAMKKLR